MNFFKSFLTKGKIKLLIEIRLHSHEKDILKYD
ncbi:hypothetical protein Cp4435_01362 [Clostridium perfringens]|nr:hypothetical protein [Clostridium perfringens]